MDDNLNSDQLNAELKNIQPGWKKPMEPDGDPEGAADDEVLGNYDHNLIGTPKQMTSFEVNKTPGRLG